jgi:hypothetical protein
VPPLREEAIGGAAPNASRREKTFVDFCDGISLIDPHTGELSPTQLFVGALSASSYTFATATLTQQLPDWLDCHVRMYEFSARSRCHRSELAKAASSHADPVSSIGKPSRTCSCTRKRPVWQC